MKIFTRILENLLELILLVVSWCFVVGWFTKDRTGKEAALFILFIIVAGWILFALSFILQSCYALYNFRQSEKHLFVNKVACFIISGLTGLLYLLSAGVSWDWDGTLQGYLAVAGGGLVLYLIILFLIYAGKKGIWELKKNRNIAKNNI